MSAEARNTRPLTEVTEDELIRSIRTEQADAAECHAELIHRGWSDQHIVNYMLRGATPVGIHRPGELGEFANRHGLSHDWHEPDNHGVGARIIGTHLDNAMGSTTRAIGENNESGEFNVVLTHDGRDTAVVNLATLLSWACRRA